MAKFKVDGDRAKFILEDLARRAPVPLVARHPVLVDDNDSLRLQFVVDMQVTVHLDMGVLTSVPNADELILVGAQKGIDDLLADLRKRLDRAPLV